MAKEFSLEVTEVAPVATKHRQVSGFVPDSGTVESIKQLRTVEPRSMRGQAPIIWDRAEGVQVYDKKGNMWLDFSSGVLVTNAGHGHQRIVEAIIAQVSQPLLTSYCFPNRARIELTKKIASLAPEGLKEVFLLSTGSEATECALKLMRTFGRRKGGDQKSVIVSFENAFHGRTLGAQQLGGIAAGKAWIKNLDPEIVQAPFPDGFRCEDISFSLFEKTLAARNIAPQNVAGVITETYQGGGVDFLPRQYAQDLRDWCDKYGAVLCFDEVQAGFGRCGRQWGFELYGVAPDLFCLGKGISSSLPISAVVGKQEIMDLYGPNEMTSTHSGNPVCCAAALANIEAIIEEGLIENSAKVGAVLQAELHNIKEEFSEVVGACHGAGLVAGLLMVKKGAKEPDYELAWEAVNRCFRKGLLLFAPVGFGGATIKIAPPLCIGEDAVREGCEVIRESISQCVKRC